MIELIGIGELLIDFTPSTLEGQRIFTQNAGGAPCNMLAMAQSMGTSTGFIGKVGDDSFGHFLKSALVTKQIDVEGLILAENVNTTLAFVHLESSGERSFSFYRKGCADIALTLEDINLSRIEKAKALHFGSLSFTDEPSKSAVLEAVAFAKQKGLLLTYDPNYRPALWENQAAAIEGMKLGLAYADVVKVSEEEALLLTGQPTVLEAAEALFNRGIQLICVTLGGEGSFYYHGSGHGIVSGFDCRVVDTTGAGDSFFGALVHHLIESNQKVENLTKEAIEHFFKVANAAASLCIEDYGGMPSIPSRDAVLERAMTKEV